MVTGWFAPGRFRLIGGILASGASVFAPQADGWYSVRGAGTVPSLFMQLAWPGGMSLQAEWPSVFAVVSSIARELFRPRGGQIGYISALVMCRIGGLIGRMPAGTAWPQSISA